MPGNWVRPWGIRILIRMQTVSKGTLHFPWFVDEVPKLMICKVPMIATLMDLFHKIIFFNCLSKLSIVFRFSHMNLRTLVCNFNFHIHLEGTVRGTCEGDCKSKLKSNWLKQIEHQFVYLASKNTFSNVTNPTSWTVLYLKHYVTTDYKHLIGGRMIHLFHCIWLNHLKAHDLHIAIISIFWVMS